MGNKAVSRKDGSFDKNPDYQAGDEDNAVAPLVSYSECVDIFINELSNYGYTLHPDPIGRFCLFSVYKRMPCPITAGLNVPDDFYYLGRIDPSNAVDRAAFYRAVKSAQNDLVKAFKEREKAKAKNINMIALNFLDSASDVRTKTAAVALSRMSAGSGSVKVNTLTGASGQYKFVPPLEWFTPELQALDCRKLLTLFPDAEADQLMLILGRIVAGAKGSRAYEGELQHTARSFAIVVGQEPGLGKSTFKNHLESTLNLLGYDVSGINPRLGNFGWGKVADSDIASIDDMTDEFIGRFLKESRVMSAVSNDKLTVEEKGQPAYEAQSRTVVLGLTNVTNYTHYLGMSPGFISRLNQLYTYQGHELKERWTDLPDARIKQYWESLAESLGVTVPTLVARLLRHCLDLFLAVSGHYLENGILRYDRDKDTLEARMSANRDNFIIDVKLSHAEELTTCAANLLALTISRVEEDKEKYEYLERLNDIDFNPEILLSVVELFCLDPDLIPESIRDCVPTHLSRDCIRYVVPKRNDLKRMTEAKSITQAFEAVIGELKSNKGFGYPRNAGSYQSKWLNDRRSIPSLMSKYDGIKLNSQVRAVIAEVDKLFH